MEYKKKCCDQITPTCASGSYIHALEPLLVDLDGNLS